MEVLVMFLIVVIGLTAVGAASVRWGADSRGTLPDDHAR